jgi:hypothetical protein
MVSAILISSYKKWIIDVTINYFSTSYSDKHVLCDQEEETVQHILTSCVSARDFRFSVLTIVPTITSRRCGTSIIKCKGRTESKSWQMFYTVARARL